MPKQLNCYYSIIGMTYLPIKSELYSSKLLSTEIFHQCILQMNKTLVYPKISISKSKEILLANFVLAI
jgi:hypothetical protein